MHVYKKYNYLKQLELTYKYKILRLSLIPALQKVVILLPIKNFLAAYDYEYKNTKESLHVYIKAFFFMYLSFFQVPQILISSNQKVKHRDKNSAAVQEYSHTLKVTISSLAKIQTFFSFLTLENSNYLSNITFIKHPSFASSVKSCINTHLLTNVNLNTSNSLHTLSKALFEEINLKELSVSLNILVAKPTNILNTNALLKNLSLLG